MTPRQARFSRAPLWVLLFSLTATFLAWHFTQQEIRRRSALQFDGEVRRAKSLLKERIGLYLNGLHGTQALFAASKSVERQEWNVYVEKENLRGRYPGITAVSFVERVPAASSAAFVESVRADVSVRSAGYPRFEILPPGPRDEYFVVKYLHPEPGNEAMLGRDLGADETLRPALEKARDGGGAVATPRLTLFREGGAGDSFFLFLPIYANGAPASTVEERRRALEGFVGAAFRVNDLLTNIYGEALKNSRIDFEVYEGSEPKKENLLYDNFNEIEVLDPDYQPAFTARAPIRIADRVWTLRFTSLPGFGPAQSRLPLAILCCGLGFSALLFGIVFSLSAARVRAVMEAEAAASGLQESRDKLRRAAGEAESLARELGERRAELERLELRSRVLALLETSTEPAAYGELLALVGGSLGAQAGVFWKTDRRAAVLRCADFWRAPGKGFMEFESVTRQRTFAAGVGLPGRVLTGGRPAWIPDVSADSNFPRAPIAAKDNLRGAVAFPASAGGETLAVMEFFFSEARRPDEALTALLADLGRLAGGWMRQRETEALLDARTEELGRARSEFEQFANAASHDLQEPLGRISSYLTLLEGRSRLRLDGESRRFMDQISNGVGTMRRLLDDLLSYAQAARGEIALEPTNVGAVMSQTLDALGETIEETGAAVTYDPLPTVMANAAQMSQLLRNLIDNAVKYRAERPPRVHVSARRKDDEWHFSVTDNGIGIELQYSERIFIMFQRLPSRQEAAGTGVGLALCKKIVERHGGRIWVESEPGRGATFHFTLPIR